MARQILEASKHVYNEKPFTVRREESLQLLGLAAGKGLRTGGAPDTFFGSAWQTARKAIDDGLIGRPFAAMAVLHWKQSAAEAQGAAAPTSPTRSTAPWLGQLFPVRRRTSTGRPSLSTWDHTT